MKASIPQPRNLWKTKRFRLALGALVTAVLAVLAGDVSILSALGEHMDAVVLVVVALLALFSGSGQVRLERMASRDPDDPGRG